MLFVFVTQGVGFFFEYQDLAFGDGELLAGDPIPGAPGAVGPPTAY